MDARLFAIGLVGCARATTPLNIAPAGSIDPLPSASPLLSPTSMSTSGELTVTKDELVLPSPVYFKVGSAELLPDSEPLLLRVVEFSRARRDAQLHVEVHTDGMGAAQYNLILSEKRATAVGRWLVDHGVDCRMIDAHGFGQTQPIAPNSTEEGRAKNRRTVIRVDPWAKKPASMFCP